MKFCPKCKSVNVDFSFSAQTSCTKDVCLDCGYGLNDPNSFVNFPEKDEENKK